MMDITLVYFVYGLAFFCMGLVMLLESERSPLLAQARVLLPLAVFGFVHGSHEWLEMFLDKSEWLVFRYPEQISWLRISVLALSFTSLIVFGLSMWEPGRRFTTQETARWGAGLGLYVLVVILVGLYSGQRHADWLWHLDAAARYLLAVPGALLAGLALYRQAARARRQDRPKMGTGLLWAAWGFILYSLTQAVVPPLDAFPASLLNTANFIDLFGMPVQVFRAVLAVVVTIGLMRAVGAAEEERQRQLFYMQQARLDALEQVRKELVKREALRQELMRHTVIAQEEERGRIARELHDETAQVLTAFSLHLAALGDVAPGNAGFRDKVAHMQALSRQMSQGIYRLVHDLRPAQLDDLGLVPALEYLVDEDRRRMGLQVDLQIHGPRERLDPLVETVLFRVAQESLTNISRHAGVSQASLELRFEPGAVHLRVFDQGVGFDLEEHQLPPQGWGLAGMRERVASVSGHLHLRSTPGEGTLVEVTVPLSN